MSDELDKAISDFTEKINSIPVNKSKEEAWKEFLNKSLPVPAIIGEENKVVDNRLVEGIKVLYIIDKDFSVIEQTENVWDGGELSDDANALMEKYGFTIKELILDDSIEDSKLHFHLEFSIDTIENDYKKESSDEYKKFEEEMKIASDKMQKKFLEG